MRNINNKIIACPRCNGKGFVEADDIKKLDKIHIWAPGECAYCDGFGLIKKKKTESLNIDDESHVSKITEKKVRGTIKELLDVEDNLYILKNFSQFIQFFETNVCEHFVFRGVSDRFYLLKSKIGRTLNDVENKNDFLLQEQTLMELFKSKATAHTGMQQISEWQWIVMAQHYGLSTRLLDWTENPLVALFFASTNHPDRDGALYLWHFSKALNLSYNKPFEFTHSGFFIPPYLTNRIISQASIFSISCRPWLEFQDDFDGEIMKIIISAEFKKELQKLLPRLGINRRTIFADLDSYARDIDEIYNSKKCKSGGIFIVD